MRSQHINGILVVFNFQLYNISKSRNMLFAFNQFFNIIGLLLLDFIITFNLILHLFRCRRKLFVIRIQLRNNIVHFGYGLL